MSAHTGIRFTSFTPFTGRHTSIAARPARIIDNTELGATHITELGRHFARLTSPDCQEQEQFDATGLAIRWRLTVRTDGNDGYDHSHFQHSMSTHSIDAESPIGGAKSGAPIGNGNAVRHGLTTGKLPRGAAYIARITNQFRSALETAVADRNGGEISLHDAATIQSACRWERHALLCQRWLRKEAEDLTPDQRLAFSRDVARASEARDKCLRALGLDIRQDADEWAAVDALLRTERENKHQATLADASSRGDDSTADDLSDAAGDATDDDVGDAADSEVCR